MLKLFINYTYKLIAIWAIRMIYFIFKRNIFNFPLFRFLKHSTSSKKFQDTPQASSFKEQQKRWLVFQQSLRPIHNLYQQNRYEPRFIFLSIKALNGVKLALKFESFGSCIYSVDNKCPEHVFKWPL